MKFRIASCVLAVVVGTAGTAHAFFEEGNDDNVRAGYMKCTETGNLAQADSTGCNPWPDWDSSYAYKLPRDMKKNSLHFNATAALAVAAGFDRCAALLIGTFDEATDVATDYDLELWVPFLDGTSREMCEPLMIENNVEVADGLVKSGILVSPDFTYRSFSRTQTNEVVRESYTFHWNHTLSSLSAVDAVTCAPGVADPLPVPPNDMVSLGGLQSWVNGENTLNACTYDAVANIRGPIASYAPETDVAPGSLGAMGVFLHSLQDAYSHRACSGSSHNFGANTTSPCGFSSGHYAGDFGVVPSTNQPGSATIDVTTKARSKPYKIALHSDQSVLALMHTYEVLKNYLVLHPEYDRGAEACSDEVINAFATRFASVPNYVPASGQASGAKVRSDMADALFKSDTCGL